MIYIQALKFQIECTCPSGKLIIKNHLSECTIDLSEIYKANATYAKIRNMQLSVGQVLQVFHLSDCNFYFSQMIGWVKFRTWHSPYSYFLIAVQKFPPSYPISPLQCLSDSRLVLMSHVISSNITSGNIWGMEQFFTKDYTCIVNS